MLDGFHGDEVRDDDTVVPGWRALNIDPPKDLKARLHAIAGAVDGRIVFTTSFGIEAQLLAHHIFTEKLPIDVVTLDTGRLFSETYDLWQETEERYGARIYSISPNQDQLSDLVADQGINGFKMSREARLTCCDVRKVQPMKLALAGASGWLTGLRADQSRQRSSVRIATWEPQHDLVKFAPIFDWTRDEVAAECDRLGIKVNALHAQGYPSIGCQPCTRAVAPGEDERAGRWWWEGEGARECGLHWTGTRFIRADAA